jgi:hypothetical protein
MGYVKMAGSGFVNDVTAWWPGFVQNKNRVLSRTSASYYRFLALSLVIYPFPAILLASSIITQTEFVVFGYVWGCCVVLQECPRSHCGISKSQMNEMVNLIPTCIVSNKKLFQDDSSQFWKAMYIHV